MQQNIQYHRNTQHAVKSVLDELTQYIDSSASEKSIAFAARELLEKERVKFKWFHDIQISVASGMDTRRCKTSKYSNAGNTRLGKSNLINVNLKSVNSDCVGDCSRSYVIENKKVVLEPKTQLMSEGLSSAYLIHQEMKEYITPETQFHELYMFSDNLLNTIKFENLDVNNHFGHSVSLNGESRNFIESSNFNQLCDVDFFSYNIHICKQNSSWGFRYENTYFVNKFGNIEEL